jgi:hypothetical protein
VPIKWKDAKARPVSFSSVSTSGNTSSMRSAATAAESFSSRHEGGRGRLSVVSANKSDAGRGRLSSMGGRDVEGPAGVGGVDAAHVGRKLVSVEIPIEAPRWRKHNREGKSASGCLLQ